MVVGKQDSAPDRVGGAAVDAVVESAARAEAGRVFGSRMDIGCRYAEMLRTTGVLRGLIGPREAPRLWSRHMMNCAVLTELLPQGAHIADVGSGAGLPGIVLGICRPDLDITLIESLSRRATFLVEVVEELDLASVRVMRARAEECPGRLGDVEIVTARAVASLDRLAAWCLPLLGIGGRILAIKGDSAEREISEHSQTVRRLGGGTPAILHCGQALLETPVTVVEIVREHGGKAPARSVSRSTRQRERRGRR